MFVVELLFDMLPIACVSSVFVFVLLCIALCPFWFCNHLEGEERAVCFAIVLQMCCYYWCSCVAAIGILWLFLAMPWVGLRCVVVLYFLLILTCFGSNV